MSVGTHASALPELEEELEGEFEGEEFLGSLARRAAQAVLGSLGGQSDSEFEMELEDEDEGEEFLGSLGGIVRGLLGEGELEDEWEGEYELEGEWEGEFEDEGERLANPLRRAYPDAMMEHLGHAAAEAETEAEAEAFIGALVPLAAGLVRSAAPTVARSVPHLVRGLSRVTRTLRRNPTTRQLVRAIPTIASRTTRSLARQASQGRPITARRTARTLAGQTVAVLSNPRVRSQTVRRARALDRTYHQAARTGQWQAVTGDRTISGTRALAPRMYRPGGYPSYGMRVAQPQRRLARGPGYRHRWSYPPGPSVAWIPVPAWYGYPPAGARRY